MQFLLNSPLNLLHRNLVVNHLLSLRQCLVKVQVANRHRWYVIQYFLIYVYELELTVQFLLYSFEAL